LDIKLADDDVGVHMVIFSLLTGYKFSFAHKTRIYTI
jgi:hypothetical protein